MPGEISGGRSGRRGEPYTIVTIASPLASPAALRQSVPKVRRDNASALRPPVLQADAWIMKDRKFPDSIVGTIVTLSLLGVYAVTRGELERWALPPRRRRRSAEDACTHCEGSGFCETCAPVPCRVCRGRGVMMRDERLVVRLAEMWARG